jgi:hypothetical protein
MLITLQSSSDTDANDFYNYFKQGLILEPDSELGLVNMSYNFESAITLTGSNNTFDIKLAKDVDTTITIPVGSYQPDTFLQAITDALNAFVSGRPYEIERLFKITVSADATNKLVLEFDYSPEEWAVLPVKLTSTTDRQSIVLTNSNMMSDEGDGIITQTESTSGLDLRTFHSGSGADFYPVWGTSSDVEIKPHGSYFFTPQQNDSSLILALEDSGKQGDISDSSVQFVLSALTFDILERNSAGTPQSILITAIAYNAFDEFEIRVEQIEDTPEKIRYFKNGIEIITGISSTADRWFPRKDSKLICAGSFDTGKVDAKIVDADGTYAILDCLVPANITITNAGSGYLVGEHINIPAISSKISTARVDSVNGTGGILTFTILQHAGSIAGAGESITLTGQISGANNATITTGVPVNSCTLVGGGGGTAYITGLADILLNDGFTTIVGAVDIITLVGNGVSDFTWQDLLIDQVSIGDILTIVQGTAIDATITINAVDSSKPSVADVKWTTIASGVDEPLLKQSQVKFTPSSGFLSLTSLPAISGDADPSLKSVGTIPTTDTKETDQMLVNIDQFQIKSVCKEGGLQKAVASVPYGKRENTDGSSSGGYFFYESYNILYQKLENKQEENHNQLRIRLTDAVGNPISQLKHPTTITLDLKPRGI